MAAQLSLCKGSRPLTVLARVLGSLGVTAGLLPALVLQRLGPHRAWDPLHRALPL